MIAAARLTGFELDPHTSIVLDLLDHLSVSADDDAHSKPRHCHLFKHTAVRLAQDTHEIHTLCVCAYIQTGSSQP